MKVAIAKTLGTVHTHTHTIYLENETIRENHKIKKYGLISNAIKLYIKYNELKINLWEKGCQNTEFIDLNSETRYLISNKLVF